MTPLITSDTWDLFALWLVFITLLAVVAYLIKRRRKPMATWRRRGFSDQPFDDPRSSIEQFKRIHRP